MVAFSLARSVSSARTRPCTSSFSVPGGLWPARSDSGLSTRVDTAAGVSSVGVPVAGVAASGFAVPAVSKIEVPAPPAGWGAVGRARGRPERAGRALLAVPRRPGATDLAIPALGLGAGPIRLAGRGPVGPRDVLLDVEHRARGRGGGPLRAAGRLSGGRGLARRGLCLGVRLADAVGPPVLVLLLVATLTLVGAGTLVGHRPPARERGFTLSGLVHLEQVLEQGAVVDEGLAKVLGGRLRALVGLGDGVRRAVVVDHLRMVHRDVGRALLEILDRVAALAHDLVDQPVGAAGRLGRRVDEARLDHAPLLEVAVARAGLQRHDAQLLATRAAVVELMLGRLAAARVPDRSVVLRPELVAEPRGALPAEHQPCERERHDDDDGDEQAGIHWPLLSVPCLVFGGLPSGLRRMRCRLSHSAIPVKGVPKPGTSPLP